MAFFSPFLFYVNRSENYVTFDKPRETDNSLKLSDKIEGWLDKDCLYLTSGTDYSEFEDRDSLIYGSVVAGLLFLIDFSVISKISSKKSEKKELEIVRSKLPIKDTKEAEVVVFNFVREYLSNNRIFETNKAIAFINSRLSKSDINLNGYGIDAIITNLIKKNMIIEGSKYTRDDVLKNSNRMSIYTTILENPGIHFMRIVGALGMSIFLVKWHLDMLLKFNYIKRTQVGHCEIYFDSALSAQKASVLHFLSREKTIKIMNYLRENSNGCPKYRLSKEIKMHPNTITKYIQKLEEIGCISKRKVSNKTLYFVNNI